MPTTLKIISHLPWGLKMHFFDRIKLCDCHKSRGLGQMTSPSHSRGGTLWLFRL
jgi:hypothetical protein